MGWGIVFAIGSVFVGVSYACALALQNMHDHDEDVWEFWRGW